MANEESDQWVKTQLIEAAKGQTIIISKLETGEGRMTAIESNLGDVMEATRKFPALIIDVELLKRVEEERKAQHIKDLEKQLAEKIEEAKESKAKWSDRIYDLSIKALPYLCIAGMYLYTQIKT